MRAMRESSSQIPAASVGNRAPAVLRRSERGDLSSASDDEVGGTMRAMREQLQKKGAALSSSAPLIGGQQHLTRRRPKAPALELLAHIDARSRRAAKVLGGFLRSCAPGHCSRAQLARTELVQPLGQQVLELGDGTPFPEHVPVGTRGLLLFQLRPLTIGTKRFRAAPGALPHRRNFGLSCENEAEMVISWTVVADLLPSRELNTCLVLKAFGPETGALQ
jgi:hypothetical protein